MSCNEASFMQMMCRFEFDEFIPPLLVYEMIDVVLFC